MKNEIVVLLDVKGALMRSYYASKGQKTVTGVDNKQYIAWESGFRTFVNLELPVLLEWTAPKNIILVKDSGTRYRSTLYPKYKEKRKAERKKRDPIEIEQMKIYADNVENFLLNLGAKIISVAGVEADDVIAHLAASLKDSDVVIRTNDADLLQLVGGNVQVQMLSNNEVYQEGDYYKGADLPVTLIRLHKSLVGDSSDEYGGVPGFGHKAWESCVEAYGYDGMEQIEQCVKTGDMSMLEAAYKATGDKNLAKILDNVGAWKLCYNLASLHPELCYLSYRDSIVKPTIEAKIPSRSGVSTILGNAGYEDRDMKEKLFSYTPTFELVTAENVEELKAAVAEMENTTPRPAYDFESYDTLKHPAFKQASKSKGGIYVDVLSQSITGISFCYGENYQHTKYVCFNHKDTSNLSKDWAKWLVASLYQVSDRPIVQNAAFELSVAKTDLDLEVEHAPYDTQIMASYWDENVSSGLKNLSKEIFGYHQQTYAETIGDKEDMSQLTGKEVLSYGCDDSLVTAYLYDYFYLSLCLEGTAEFYETYEVDWALDNVDSFVKGTDIDTELLDQMHKEDQHRRDKEVERVRQLLQENVSDPNAEDRTKRANALFYERLNYLYAAEGFSEGQAATTEEEKEHAKKMAQERDKIWKRVYDATVYVPYEEREEELTFLATPAQFNALFEAVGSDVRFEKLTQKYLVNWVAENEEKIASAEGDEREIFDLIIEYYRFFTPKKRDTDEFKKFQKRMSEIKSKYFSGKVSKSGTLLDFGSSKQMQEMLYCLLGLPIRHRSKVDMGSTRDKLGLPGSPGTGNGAIAKAIAYDVEEGDWRHEVLMLYKEIVAIDQNISLFYKPYKLWVHPRDDKIHPQLKNCGTVTRRPSGTSPNVLQVSDKGDSKIRKLYTSWHLPEKYVHVGVDIQSQELLIAAELSQDPVMLAAFDPETKRNLHSVTASGIYKYVLPFQSGNEGMPATVDYELFETIRNGENEHQAKVAEKIRKAAKAVNFLTIFAGSAHALSERLMIPVELAEKMLDGFFQTYPGYRKWMEYNLKFARQHGYVLTAYGNRRHLNNDLFSENYGKVGRIERQATNSPVQGTAADSLKEIMTEYRRRRMVQRYHARSIKTVYDELNTCVPLAAAQEYCEEMAEVTRIRPPGFKHSFDIDMAIGTSWGTMKEIGEFSPEAVADRLQQLKDEAKNE